VCLKIQHLTDSFQYLAVGDVVDFLLHVHHLIPFTSFHQAVPPSMVHALVAFGATLVNSYLCKRKRMKSEGLVESPWKKVPGGRRFFGNLTRESSTFQETVDHWASLYGQDGIFEANLAGKKYVFLCNEKKASIIFSKRPFQVKKSRRLSKAMNSLHLCGIFTAEGEDWERERRFSCSALNHKNVKNYLPTVKLVTSRSLEKWENHSEMGHVFVFFRYCFSCYLLSRFEQFEHKHQPNADNG